MDPTSASLLQYVLGLSKTVAENIVTMRGENGKFISRAQLKKIPRLGAKTYEQAIGFLRISEAKNPLDATGIHPESYKLAEEILQAASLTKKDVGTAKAEQSISQFGDVTVPGSGTVLLTCPTAAATACRPGPFGGSTSARATAGRGSTRSARTGCATA